MELFLLKDVLSVSEHKKMNISFWVRRFPPDFWTTLGHHSRERQLANGGEIRRIPDTDDDSESEAPVNPGLGFNYNDIDNVLLLSSSSAAAATCSSDTYFVDEPDPEPEPDIG